MNYLFWVNAHCSMFITCCVRPSWQHWKTKTPCNCKRGCVEQKIMLPLEGGGGRGREGGSRGGKRQLFGFTAASETSMEQRTGKTCAQNISGHRVRPLCSITHGSVFISPFRTRGSKWHQKQTITFLNYLFFPPSLVKRSGKGQSSIFATKLLKKKKS